jgi:class 3 adenylate cyclase
MPLKEQLEAAVAKIFRDQWTERDGRVVPVPDDLGLGNDAVKLNATVLYADMADSTKLVDTKNERFAAEIYKTYLTCAAKIVKDEGGTITAYDGDRIMAVFLGDAKNTNAVRAALRINAAVAYVINPTLARQYPQTDYRVTHHIGIDTSSLHVSRIGVRNDNDLVWVGRAANYAAKLCAIKEYNTIFVTEEVFGNMHESVTYSVAPRLLIWKERQWIKWRTSASIVVSIGTGPSSSQESADFRLELLQSTAPDQRITLNKNSMPFSTRARMAPSCANVNVPAEPCVPSLKTLKSSTMLPMSFSTNSSSSLWVLPDR